MDKKTKQNNVQAGEALIKYPNCQALFRQRTLLAQLQGESWAMSADTHLLDDNGSGGEWGHQSLSCETVDKLPHLLGPSFMKGGEGSAKLSP